MALRIQCPGCQQVLQIADEQRGKQVRCPTCGMVMQVPGTSLPAPAATWKPVPLPAGPPRAVPAPADQAIASAERPWAGAPVANPRGEEETLPRAPAHRGRQDRANAAARTDRDRSGRRSGLGWFLGGAGGAVVLLGALLVLLGSPGGPRPADPPPLAQGQQPPPPNHEVKKVEVKTSNYPPKAKDDAPPAPAVVEAPLPKPVEPPPGPVPPFIDSPTTRKVKKATAYLRVTLASGLPVEGSGFFAAEPGLVFTNAHVLGMLGAASKAPSKVDVVINSGEPDEILLGGHILGVDRSSDLAILRVTGDAARWPAPLPLDGSDGLTELQKVYVFGFPYGARLGKNITVSESSVSSVRRGSDGSVAQIQVNGGMNPGNSGGPVVDSRGAVVGVAVSIISGTQINFAVPGEKVQGLLRGRVADVQIGEAYMENGQVKLPVRVECLDPLQRIRGLRADVWTGKPGAVRTASVKPPEPLPGDSVRQLVPLRYQRGKAAGDLVLPAVGAGEVVWIQPALNDRGGATTWGSATPFTPSAFAPLQRAPAVLVQHYDVQAERTIKLNYVYHVKMAGAANQAASTTNTHMEALELAQIDPRGGQCRLTIGSCSQTRQAGEQTLPVNPQAQALLRNKYFAFTTDQLGTLLQQNHPTLNPPYPLGLRRHFDDLVGQVANGYEMTCISVPNRLVQAGETWTARIPLIFVNTGKRERAALVATCAFEGTRMLEGQNQALISLTGTIRSLQPGTGASGAKLTGKVHFGIDKGYVTRADLRIESERDDMPFVQTLNVTLTRAPGNLLGITPAQPAPAGPVAQGKLLRQFNAVLTSQDRADDPQRPNCYYKTFSVKLNAGQTYLVEMNKIGQSTLDPYLILVDPTGKRVAEDDDSGGDLNALILYRPQVAGEYQIRATTFLPRNEGAFTLRVSEIVQSNPITANGMK